MDYTYIGYYIYIYRIFTFRNQNKEKVLKFVIIGVIRVTSRDEKIIFQITSVIRETKFYKVDSKRFLNIVTEIKIGR